MYTNIYQTQLRLDLKKSSEECTDDREGEQYGQFIGWRMENYEPALGL